MTRSAAFFAVVSLACVPAAAAAADLALGKAVFGKCKICHTIEPGGGGAIGPNLHGVFGRKAGSLDGFGYSSAMKNSGIVWDDETLGRFLREPKGVVPGNRMAFPAIKDEKAIADLLAYLKAATQ